VYIFPLNVVVTSRRECGVVKNAHDPFLTTRRDLSTKVNVQIFVYWPPKLPPLNFTNYDVLEYTSDVKSRTCFSVNHTLLGMFCFFFCGVLVSHAIGLFVMGGIPQYSPPLTEEVLLTPNLTGANQLREMDGTSIDRIKVTYDYTRS